MAQEKNEKAVLDAFKGVQANGPAVDASKKVRVGIIGCGWIADAHMTSYLKQPDVEIVAGADLVPGKAAAFFAKYADKVDVSGIKCDYPSHKEMIADKSLKLDCVSICTYNRTHAVCAIDALNAGINVLLEKPMCVTLDEAVEICRAEKKSGKVLSIGFQPRFDPNMQMIGKVCRSGELGKIYYIQTGGGRRQGIPFPYGTSFIEDKTAGLGALGDIGCYSLDCVLNAIGYPKPLTVSGYKSAYFGTSKEYAGYVNSGHTDYADKFGVDDFAAAFIRLEGGIILDFRIAWAMHLDSPGDTIIMGTKGSLRVPATECWNGSFDKPMKLYKNVAGQDVVTEIPLVPGSVGLFERKIRTFLDASKNGGKSPVPSSQIIYNQAIIDGIARSADAGREVEIHVPEI
ncbi:MAG: Gfo/Idh/MocA family oxidoreductase [Clostridia bacterium]|nr:Gfo/Idh/MocA family oxidoreductase [Clostridia bacterium]